MKKISLFILALIVGVVTVSAQQKPKYIFYFIGDGMGNGHVMSAWQYNRMVRGMETPLLMTTFPVVGQSTTYSASSPVTDSAAAGTALATGTKTRNGMLGMDPDTTALVSMAFKLRDEGYGIGVLSSVALNDATPGAFYAHQPTRKNYYEIAVEAAHSGFEFLGGPGFKGLKKRPEDIPALMAEFAQNNVTLVRGHEEMQSVDTRKVVMFKTDTLMVDNLGYTIDSIPGALTLKTLTVDCLDHLLKVSPDRFFMMVEGGNIDWAGHANDGATVIKEIAHFDESLRIAYDFYLAHPDETLIVVTADHDTGGMSLGNQYLHYNANLQYADQQRVSKDTFTDLVRSILNSRRIYTWDDMEQYLKENMGFWTVIPLTPEQTQLLHESFNKTFIDRTGTETEALYNNYSQFVSDVFGIMQDFLGIGWTTMNHTGNPVAVYAIGVGANRFSTLTNNNLIPTTILSIAGY